MRILDPEYEGISSGVRGYQCRCKCNGIQIRDKKPGYEGINNQDKRVYISGVQDYEYPGKRRKVVKGSDVIVDGIVEGVGTS